MRKKKVVVFIKAALLGAEMCGAADPGGENGGGPGAGARGSGTLGLVSSVGLVSAARRETRRGQKVLMAYEKELYILETRSTMIYGCYTNCFVVNHLQENKRTNLFDSIYNNCY